MKKTIKIVIIILTFVILFRIFLKFKNIDKKIEVVGLSLNYPKNLQDFTDLLIDYFYCNVKVTIANYSNVDINLNQLKVDLFTLKDNLFVQQIAPLQKSIQLRARKNTEIELKYKLNYTNIAYLLTDNNLKDELKSRLIGLALYQKLNTQIIAKGFIEVANVTIPLNEKIDI